MVLQVLAPHIEIYFYCILCEKQEFHCVCMCMCVCVCVSGDGNGSGGDTEVQFNQGHV